MFYALSEPELRELRQFVRSPFHNQREDVVQLFDILRKTPWERVVPAHLFKQVYPGKTWDKTQLAYVMSYLLKVMEDYLSIAEMRQDPVQEQLYLMRNYRRHRQELGFRKQARRINQLLAASPLEDLQTHYMKYQLGMEEYNLQKNRRRGISLNLREPTEQLDVFLIGSRLRQACTMLAHEKLSEVQYEYGLLQQLIDFLESPAQERLRQTPVIALYYHSYKTLREESEADFQQLQILLREHRSHFTPEEWTNFFVVVINFGIKRLNQGQRAYVRITFDWYREGLQQGAFIENKMISSFHFKNIIALGLGLQEFDWVEQFLYKYKPFLEAADRENNFKYNFAKLNYEKKDYKAAMLLLQEVRYEETLPNLTAKILLLKIYFELDEKEVLHSYLKSFESIVRRQRGLGYHKESYLNLILTVRRLLHLNPFDKAAREKLKQSITMTEVLPEKTWLLAQLDALA